LLDATLKQVIIDTVDYYDELMRRDG